MIQQKLFDIMPILEREYGPKKLVPNHEPMQELVTTILSQNTSDTNTARSWASLHARFPTWDAIREAPTEEIIDAIVSGGLAQTKGPRIQNVLRETRARLGSDDLSSLATMPAPGARAWLTSLPGVGGKTASCVLLFALGLPAMPVDTHVHRLAGRIGLTPPTMKPDQVGEVLEQALGNNPQAIYALHMGLILHGRTICLARKPRCSQCPIRSACDYPDKT